MCALSHASFTSLPFSHFVIWYSLSLILIILSARVSGGRLDPHVAVAAEYSTASHVCVSVLMLAVWVKAAPVESVVNLGKAFGASGCLDFKGDVFVIFR
jgi:hypothetical protein